jgi:uncharacterized protein YvpB
MFTEPVSSGEQIPLHNFRIPLLIAAFCLVPGISVCGRGIDVRVVVPVRAATVVFVSLIAMAMMLAAIGPAWMRMGSLAYDRFSDFRPGISSQPRSAMLDGVFTYQQQRSLSCEYASLYIATSLLGSPVSEYVFDDLIPLNDNPHLGYRGNILGEWGNTEDYGVYSEPLAAALDQVGFKGNAFYGGRDELTRELDLGRPVVVWLGFWGDSGSFDAFDSSGARYQLTAGMHVLVVYGYDATTVYLTDPGTSVLRQYSWGEFLGLWDVMDGMALSVYREQ